MRLLTSLLCLALAACSTPGPATNSTSPDANRRALAALGDWSLRGRLNIRNGDASDTININWQQQSDSYDIRLSGSLGLGAARVSGNARGVLIEKAGEDPVAADSLEALTVDMLGYAFPARELVYWVRGLPAPGRPFEETANAEGFTATLSQTDLAGRRWHLQYDRQANQAGYILPGRIRLEQAPYRLTFVISDWDLPGGGSD